MSVLFKHFRSEAVVFASFGSTGQIKWLERLPFVAKLREVPVVWNMDPAERGFIDERHGSGRTEAFTNTILHSTEWLVVKETGVPLRLQGKVVQN